MKIKELESEIINKGYDIYDVAENNFYVSFNVASGIFYYPLFVHIIFQNGKILMTDNAYLVKEWARSEIVNTNPIKKIEEFANRFGINFNNLALEKELDPNVDVDKQLTTYFKVLFFEDITLCNCTNTLPSNQSLIDSLLNY